MRRIALTISATLLTCCGRYNDGTYDRLSWGQPVPTLLAGVPTTISLTRRRPSEAASPMTAESLACIPADTCEARPLNSIGGMARFEVVPRVMAEGLLRLEPIVRSDRDGTMWADELVVPVEATGEVLVVHKDGFRVATDVSVEVGETVELCLQVRSTSGRAIDAEGLGASVELRQPEQRLVEVTAARGCFTFRGRVHGVSELVFSVAGTTRTVQARVFAPDRIRSFVATEVAQEGSQWIDLGKAPNPLVAMAGSVYRYYRIEGVADDGLRRAFLPRCFTVNNGLLDSLASAGAPEVFSLWLQQDTATLRWSNQCGALSLPLEFAIRR